MIEEAEAPQDENKIIAERRAKLDSLREQGDAFLMIFAVMPMRILHKHMGIRIRRHWSKRVYVFVLPDVLCYAA